MKVLINGLPLFARRLANDLQQADPKSSFRFFDTYNSKLEQLKFLLHLPFADCVISFNGVSDKSGSLDWVVRFKKKLILQWMGTDSIIALERKKKQTLDKKYIDYAKNFADSSWLIDEVSQLGVEVERLDFKYRNSQVKPIDKYKEMSAVSYVAQKRQAFYGIDMIKAAAQEFPDMLFHIYGMDSSSIDLPANVKLYGWVDELTFAKAVQESPIFLRLPEHDGYSASVIEAMGLGSEVIWTFPGEHAHFVTDNISFIKTMRKVIHGIEDRGMTPNSQLIDFVQSQYDKDRLMNIYLKKIKGFVGK